MSGLDGLGWPNPEDEPKRARAPRLTWRKEKERWGLVTYRLGRGDERLATVQESKERGKWFWYGGGRNTCSEPTDLETAKRDAGAHIATLGESGGGNPPEGAGK